MKTQIFIVLTILLSGVSSMASYCTLWNETHWGHEGRAPLDLTCMQEDGSWKNTGGFPEAPTANGDKDYFQNASLAEATNGDVLMSYERQLFNSENEMIVARYNSKAGWKRVGSTSVNAEAGKIIPPSNQFGAEVFELLGKPVVFWAQGEEAVVSAPAGDSWRNIRFSTPNQEVGFRFPQTLVSASGKLSYLYYAEPAPAIWSFDGAEIIPIPAPQIDSAKESTLQTSLVEWNGQLAMAYSSTNVYTDGHNWENSTNKTKVALYDGTSWRNITSGVEDTPGRDQMSPFLFTIGKNLYIMYEDFSTEGVPHPTNGQVTLNSMTFRLRVKQWTGLRWKRIGGESDQAIYSNRLEFLNDNGTVLTNLIQKAPVGGYRQVVMTWNNGKFGYLGKQIRSLPNFNNRSIYRPGAVVRLSN